MFDPSITVITTLRGIGVFALLLLHVGVLGYWAKRLARFQSPDFWLRLAAHLSAGFALLGFGILLVGTVGGLQAWVALVSAGLMALLGMPLLANLIRWIGEAVHEVYAAFIETPLLGLLCGGMMAMVIVCGLRAGWWVDEVEYHFAAPLLWAQNGSFVPSPYHNTNGPALAEVLFTFCAIFKSDVAAHWIQTAMLLTLVSAAAALAKRCGGSVAGAIAACLSIPVIVNQADVAYSDVIAAGFALTAYAVLYCGTTPGELADPNPSPGLALGKPQAAIAIASLLLTAAVSVKGTTIYALPVACLFVSWRMLLPGISFEARARFASRAAALAIPVLLMLGMWTLRSHHLRGYYWFEEVKGLTAHSPFDRMWLSGEHVARVPRVSDFATLPLVPIIVTALGQMEPYGGRTGLLLLCFVPLGLWSFHRLAPAQRHLAYWVLAAGAGYFLGLGPTGIKTRYHLFVWANLAVIASVGFMGVDLRGRWLRWVRPVFYVLVCAGMLDSAHVVLKRLTIYYPSGSQI